MKRWMKRIGIICLIPMVLVILISILLYIPPFQNFAVRLATEYASETTGMNIGIGQIRLSFPLNLTIRDVKVITPPDTLLSLESFQVNIRPLPLLKKEVLVDAIDLRGVKANTGNLIEGMEIKGTLGKLYAKADRIDLGKEIARLNKIDLSDTAITLLMNDTTTNKDTTSTTVGWKLKLDQIDLNRVAFAMQMPDDSLRLSTYIDKAGLTPHDGLALLKEAGMEAIPGGGAEIFDEAIRARICPEKGSSETWLAMHREAHRIGISTNATILYGHVENWEHRIDHLDRRIDDTQFIHGFG